MTHAPNPLRLFDISRDEIDEVLATFYARIRRHPELGPIFNGHVGTTDAEWDTHIALITRFWRGAILREPGYEGNPMRAHMQAGNVRPEHFTPWISLFEDVATDKLPPQTARAWIALVHRIGRGLRMGVEDIARPAEDVPSLS
ncbi:group III truncated hemoglobin [Aliiroseovarius sp. F20344]|uniref:group III truncated hemoglobin n=1 Tax=Aliiroseovarius sp. F20344 TaxID=2926414 RepID=UPI001FF5C62D|nr:group III truncated hemoglobin [Aliiroseovarius sp. F20344]MCK0142659.1 group III truncated hemoglobin [Aliiroseovarius sp. F20344]